MKLKYGRWLALGLLLSAAAAAWVWLDPQTWTTERLRSFILSFGVWSPLFFVVMYTVRPLILFPASVLSLAGGLAFGPWHGSLYVWIGATAGACLSFMLARRLGQQAIQRWAGSRLRALDGISERQGLRTILVMRLIPVIPFDAISFGAGLTRVRFKDYALGTALGMIPGILAYNFLGHSLHNILSLQFALALAVVVILSFIPWFVKKRRKVDIKE